jgi:hypothetical protein
LFSVRYWTGRRKERAKPEVGDPGLKTNGKQAVNGAIKGARKTIAKGTAVKTSGRKGAGGDHVQPSNGRRYSSRKKYAITTSQENTDMPDAYMEDIRQYPPELPVLDVGSGSEYEESEESAEEAMEDLGSDSLPPIDDDAWAEPIIGTVPRI